MNIDWTWIWRTIVDGLSYDAVKYIVGTLIASVALTYIATLMEIVKSAKTTIFFSIAAFVLLYSLIFLIAPKTQGPQLSGSMQTVVAGKPSNGQTTLATTAKLGPVAAVAGTHSELMCPVPAAAPAAPAPNMSVGTPPKF